MDREYRNFDEEKNKKVKGTFYATVTILTLVVALIGASFSYFIASASSDPNAIRTESAAASLQYNDEFRHLLNLDLIPASNNVVYYSVVKQDYSTEDNYSSYSYALSNGEDFDKGLLANSKCRDDYGNAVCSLYTFTVTNPASSGESQTLNFKISPMENSFTNLYLMVLDPNDVDANANSKTGVVLDEYYLDNNAGEEGTNLTMDSVTGNYYYDLGDSLKVELAPGESQTYQFVMYIKNLEDVVQDGVVTSSGNQTEADANKSFIAAVVVQPDDDSGQIYGVIRAAETFGS